MTKYTNGSPIYIQIKEDIKFKILKGDISLGEKLKSVRELAIEYEVTIVIMNRALNLLQNEEIIYVKRGIGNYVTEQIELLEKIKNEKVQEISKKYIDDLARLGYSKEEAIRILELLC